MDKHKTIPPLSKTTVSGSVISSKDLRIGNCLEYFIKDKLDDRQEWWEIDKCCIDDIADIDRLGLDLCGYRIININESLLLKLNAVKLDFKDFPSFNLFGMQINFINGLWIEYVSQVEIKGLHHLQNIFFFRMSEELDVSCLTDR